MVTSTGHTTNGVPEINLTDAEVLRDPFAAYGDARERSPLARIQAPGFGPIWAFTRHEEARAMLGDPRFELNADSYTRPDVPEHCLAYMRTMQEMDGPEHARLRRLVSPAFTARRAAEFRPRIEPIVDRLLDDLAEHAEDGSVDLLLHFARPLPMDVICELVGIPETDRPRWREWGAAVAAGWGQAFAEAIPNIMAGAKAAVALRRAEPGDDLISDLIRTRAEDGDRLPPRVRPRLALLPRGGPGPDPDRGRAHRVAASLPRSRARRLADPAWSPPRSGHLAARGAARDPLTIPIDLGPPGAPD